MKFSGIIFLVAAVISSETLASVCEKRIEETGWVPVNSRQLQEDVEKAIGIKRFSQLARIFGPPSILHMDDGSHGGGWVYGAKKKVVTVDCGKKRTSYFFEVHILFVESKGMDRSGACKILRRTIVSEREEIDPMQDDGVLPFTIEEKSCREWRRQQLRRNSP